jgi:hypothetical protein
MILNKKKLNKLSTKKKQILKKKKTKKHIQKGGDDDYGTLNDPKFPNKTFKLNFLKVKKILYNITVVLKTHNMRKIEEQHIFDFTNNNFTYNSLFIEIKNFLLKKKSILCSIIIVNPYSRYELNEQNFEDELSKGSFDKGCVTIVSVPLFEEQNLVEGIFSRLVNILQLSVKKPVATLLTEGRGYGINLGNAGNILEYNFKNYSDAQKKVVFKNLIERINKNREEADKIQNIEIFFKQNGVPLFYIPEYLQKLCEIFGYTLDEGIELIFSVPDNDKKMAFIYIAFGDLTDAKNKEDNSNNRAMTIAKKDFNTQYQHLFEEYQKETGWSN